MHTRNLFIDIARFYGMILVYYGHIVEQVMYLGSTEAALHYKFIYSFHMPFFFLLSGTIVTERKLILPVGMFLRQTLSARLIPYFFFSLLLAVAALFIPGWHPLGELSSVDAYIKTAVSTLLGFPGFCIPLWFMALLMSTELFHYALTRMVKNPLVLISLAVLLYFGGFYLNDIYNFVGKGKIFWFFNEVPVIYLFYLSGYLLRRSGLLDRDYTLSLPAVASLFFLIITLSTFNLNDGPFRIIQAVVIVLSGHGNIFLFPLTAFAGSLFILCLACTSPQWSFFTFMGRNSLSLFCLNGLFYHFVNPVMAKWFAKSYTISHGSILLYSLLMTTASLLLCIPFIYLLTTYVPQLMGKPMAKGPLLKPFLREPSTQA